MGIFALFFALLTSVSRRVIFDGLLESVLEFPEHFARVVLRPLAARIGRSCGKFFNVDKVNFESAESAGRLPFKMPAVNKAKEVGNANYLWISYFYSYSVQRRRCWQGG